MVIHIQIKPWKPLKTMIMTVCYMDQEMVRMILQKNPHMILIVGKKVVNHGRVDGNTLCDMDNFTQPCLGFCMVLSHSSFCCISHISAYPARSEQLLLASISNLTNIISILAILVYQLVIISWYIQQYLLIPQNLTKIWWPIDDRPPWHLYPQNPDWTIWNSSGPMPIIIMWTPKKPIIDEFGIIWIYIYI